MDFVLLSHLTNEEKTVFTLFKLGKFTLFEIIWWHEDKRQIRREVE